MSQDPHPLESFNGTARLFPLPNLVLFPWVTQPLHIFEPRYRQLMVDALAGDRLIAMALLCSGWEEDYHKRPPIHSVVCVGRILQEERLPDGRFNLLLHGLRRGRVHEELKADRLYRVARINLEEDEPVAQPGREASLRRQMVQKVTPFFSAHPPAMEQLRRLTESSLSLGALCDVFSFALPLETEVKQLLLEQLAVEQRVRLLLCSLEGRQPPVVKEVPKRPFPPIFSEN
jgi:Lon protease-like protein